MFIINFCLNMFRASLCPSSGEQRPCYFVCCTVLVLLDVVGSGCGALRCRMRALPQRHRKEMVMFVYSYCYVCSVLGILFHCVVLCIVCV